MIPHKSRTHRAILDLSFRLRLKNGGVIPSNEATTLEAPAAAIDQMGHALSRIIHALAEAGEDNKVFMAKFDIKDGFWHMDCAAGEEWNFAYVLPQEAGEPFRLVVPTSLQMGWVESPPNFCAASETARDVATWYTKAAVGAVEEHKILKHAMGGEDVVKLTKSAKEAATFISILLRCMLMTSSPWQLPLHRTNWSTLQMRSCTGFTMSSQRR
jgi:hypothetical protein